MFSDFVLITFKAPTLNQDLGTKIRVPRSLIPNKESLRGGASHNLSRKVRGLKGPLVWSLEAPKNSRGGKNV